MMEHAQANLGVFAETLLEQAREDSDLLVVTSDSRGSAKLTPFARAAPGQIVEVGIAIRAAAQLARPVYLRFGKKRMPHLPRVEPDFELGAASLIREDTDLTFLACGETVAPAFETAELLVKEGIQCRVLSLHTVKPLDQATVRQAATETGGVITVEEHSVNGGLGEACGGLLLQEGIPSALYRTSRFKIVGFPDEHTVTGSQEEIFRHYGIEGPGLATTARQ